MYLLLVDDLDTLDEMRPAIVAAAGDLFEARPVVFEEFRFVTSTGYSQRAIDEIELVLGSSHTSVALPERVERFVEYWGFGQFRDQPISTLSSGWQKYLSLALFAELAVSSNAAVLFMPFHYLDRSRTAKALEVLERQPKVLIVDLDVARLRADCPSAQAMVLDGQRLRSVPYGDEAAGPNANH